MKLYSNIETKNTYFELWGASTKHPDVRRIMDYDIEDGKFIKSQFITDDTYAFFQWVVQCISELSWGTHSHLEDFMEMTEEYFKEHDYYFF